MRAEGEVEVGEDAGLCIGVEVHEHVAADEQVEPGDGSVLHQVVAPEDHRAAQVVAEDVAAHQRLEVPLPAVGGDGAHLVGAVAALAGLGQRLLVDIGRVDLHPPAEVVLPERLGQEDGDRVRLLPRRAARTPDAKGLVGALPVDDAGDDGLGQVVPSGFVAEEPGDVDEDGVEEQGELVGVHLEEVHVLGVGVDPHLGQSLVDATLQARPLVPGEVEPAGGLDELEQGLEGLVGGLLLAHSRSASITSCTSACGISSSDSTTSTQPVSMAA